MDPTSCVRTLQITNALKIFSKTKTFVQTFGAKKSSVMSQKAMDPIPVYSNRDFLRAWEKGKNYYN